MTVKKSGTRVGGRRSTSRKTDPKVEESRTFWRWIKSAVKWCLEELAALCLELVWKRWLEALTASLMLASATATIGFVLSHFSPVPVPAPAKAPPPPVIIMRA
jgi:hypothetical protein